MNRFPSPVLILQGTRILEKGLGGGGGGGGDASESPAAVPSCSTKGALRDAKTLGRAAPMENLESLTLIVIMPPSSLQRCSGHWAIPAP